MVDGFRGKESLSDWCVRRRCSGPNLTPASVHHALSKGGNMNEEYKPATCQYCLADGNYTTLGHFKDRRCPVCGADYTGPRRDKEYSTLVEAGLVAKDD